MACNLISKVKSALKNQNVRSTTRWTDSTVVLYWLNGQECCNQFVQNRFNKILKRDDINCHYVPCKENPAYLGIRESLLTKILEI